MKKLDARIDAQPTAVDRKLKVNRRRCQSMSIFQRPLTTLGHYSTQLDALFYTWPRRGHPLVTDTGGGDVAAWTEGWDRPNISDANNSRGVSSNRKRRMSIKKRNQPGASMWQVTSTTLPRPLRLNRGVRVLRPAHTARQRFPLRIAHHFTVYVHYICPYMYQAVVLLWHSTQKPAARAPARSFIRRSCRALSAILVS